MTRLRFIHAADLHLGSPLAAVGAPSHIKSQLEQSIYTAVHHLIQDAIIRRVDFIILAGDLFDGENRGIRSQLFLKKKLAELEAYEIPVFILFGNHDPIHAEYAPMEWPDHVHIFSSTPECKHYIQNNQTVAHLYGCSYEQSAVYKNLVPLYQKEEGAPFHIGVLHGQEATMKEHMPYAPFSISDLKEKEMDYWALGHIHKRSSLSENIWYPGNIQGRHKNESGEKGYLYVELDHNGVDVSFQRVAPVMFENIDLSIDEHETIDSLTDYLIDEMSSLQNETSAGVVAEVNVYGTGRLSEYLQENDVEEWKNVLNQIGEAERPFFYIQKIKNHSVMYPIEKQETFLTDVMKASEMLRNTPQELTNEWDSLLKHPVARRFLHSDSFEQQEIIEEAKQWIRRMWQRGEGR